MGGSGIRSNGYRSSSSWGTVNGGCGLTYDTNSAQGRSRLPALAFDPLTNALRVLAQFFRRAVQMNHKTVFENRQAVVRDECAEPGQVVDRLLLGVAATPTNRAFSKITGTFTRL